MAVFFIYSQLHVREQYKGKALLPFHGNNGYINIPKCYIIPILPTLFVYHVFMQWEMEEHLLGHVVWSVVSSKTAVVSTLRVVN
jgi:hypothetical protein